MVVTVPTIFEVMTLTLEVPPDSSWTPGEKGNIFLADRAIEPIWTLIIPPADKQSGNRMVTHGFRQHVTLRPLP